MSSGDWQETTDRLEKFSVRHQDSLGFLHKKNRQNILSCPLSLFSFSSPLHINKVKHSVCFNIPWPDAVKSTMKNPWLKSRASDSPSGFFNLATRLHLPFCRLSCFICPMHCLPAVSYSDSLSVPLRWQSYCGAGFLSGLSPRLPRFPEVPLLCHLVSSVSGVLVYMWPVLTVAGLIVISEESVWRFVCYRETDDTASYARVYQTRAGFPTPTHAYNYFKTDGQLKLAAVFPPVDNFYPFVLEHLYSEFIYVLLSIDIRFHTSGISTSGYSNP